MRRRSPASRRPKSDCARPARNFSSAVFSPPWLGSTGPYERPSGTRGGTPPRISGFTAPSSETLAELPTRPAGPLIRTRRGAPKRGMRGGPPRTGPRGRLERRAASGQGDSMTTAIVVVFFLVYLGMGLGGLPFLQVDRTGVALLAARGQGGRGRGQVRDEVRGGRLADDALELGDGPVVLASEGVGDAEAVAGAGRVGIQGQGL